MFSGIYEESNAALKRAKDDKKKVPFGLEVEFRLKSYGTNTEGSVPDIDTYNSVMLGFRNQILNKKGWLASPKAVIDKVSFYDDDYRIIQIDSEFSNDNDIPIITIEKKVHPENGKIHSKIWPANLEFSYEQKIMNSRLPENIKPQNIIRRRKRYSFVYQTSGIENLPIDLVSVDFTEVKQEINGNEKTQFEIEIEAKSVFDEITLEENDDQQSLILSEMQSIMSDAGLILIKLMHKTKFLYNTLERNLFVSAIMNSFSGHSVGSKSKIPEYYINKPSTLMWQDFEINNPNGLFRGQDKMHYATTIKTDGIRILIYWHTDGIYLFNPLNQLINKIHDQEYSPLTGTMLDAELMNNVEGIYKLQVFDCLFSKNIENPDILQDIRQANLKERLAYCRYVESIHPVGKFGIYLNVKTFYPFTDTKSFYEANEKAFKLNIVNGVEQFKSDGLVITHMGPYLITRTRQNCSDCRFDKKCTNCKYFNPSLNKKYKPLNLLTTDYQIAQNMDSEFIITVVGDDRFAENRLTAFTGGTIKADPTAFERKFIDENGKEIELKVGNIAEFRWEQSAGVWIPLRIRTDRKMPNNSKVANDNWQLLNDPISKEVMLGKLKGKRILKMMKKFHNRMKIDILNEESKIITFRDKKRRPRLLDIGSGYGGDIKKWEKSNFEVLAVEPSKERLDSLESRAEALGIRKRIQTVQMGIDDPVFRVKMKNLGIPEVDLVTSFFSLTHLYGSGEQVNEVIQNVKALLKTGGKFVVMALDGQVVHEQLGDKEQISTKGITIQRSKEHKRKIIIKMDTFDDSLAKGQVEWLVDFNDFITRCESEGFELLEDSYLHSNGILNETELWYSEMNRKLVFKKMRHAPTEDVNIKLDQLKVILSKIYPSKKSNIDKEINVDWSNLLFQKSLLIGNEYVRVETINDGSSFFHAIAWAVKPEFRELDLNHRVNEIKYIRRVRFGNAFLFDDYLKLNIEHVKNPNDNLSVFSFESIKFRLMQYSNWVGFEFLNWIEDKFDINIHILKLEDGKFKKFQSSYDKKILRDKHIILIWKHLDIFEPFGIKGGKFIFNQQDELIQTLIRDHNVLSIQ
tara:strand:- start:1741 stop:4986 length:3246 start_codon:yes stop_codon:yes gene_type:complete